jgi:alanine racemase
VVILGECCDKEITLEDYADTLSFSPYEVLTGFKTRRMNVIIKNE